MTGEIFIGFALGLIVGFGGACLQFGPTLKWAKERIEELESELK